MGGQLIKGYALEGDSQGLTGLTKAWKLYRGHKAQTHSLASIFLIEKKQLKKAERDDTIKVAKKQASSLLRVRHPGVLAVVEPLTEDENILAFVTERVEGNITQLIKSGKMGEFLNSELELKLYLYPFLETVMFIHDALKQAHLAISPEHIYIAPDGKWKLAGFGINQQLTGQEQQKTEEKLADYAFSAPELAISGNFTKKSDIFSIGILIIKMMEFIHKEQKAIIIPDRSQYQKFAGELKKLATSPIIAKSSHAVDLKELLGGLLNWQGGMRWGISEVLSSRWMNDSTLITVKYLDKISSYENKQQLQFLKGLAGVLEDFDARVLSRIVLPKLIDLLKFGHLIASVTYIIIDLLKKGRLQGELFSKLVWPALKGVMQGKEMTAQAIYLFVLNYEVLEKFVGESDTVTFLLPLYIKCFDCPPKLKQLALKGIERLSRKLDYQNFKTRVIPKLLGLFKDPMIDIRKDALRALYAILKVVDAQTMSVSVLPAIEVARKSGSDGFVNAIINAIYNNLASSLPSDVLSSKILPTLIPYLSEPSISKAEFYQFKATIFNMINIIEKQREKTFGNNIVMEQANFTEADFKFKEEEVKPQAEVKGNYNFLANYIESKPDTSANTNVSPQSTGTSNVSVASLPNQGLPVVPQTLHSHAFGNPADSLDFSRPSVNQQISFGIPAYSVPVPVVSKPQAPIDDMTTINYPLPSIELKPPSASGNTNLSIKPTIMQPLAAKPIVYDFQGLSNYQPLDLSFPNDSPALSFDSPPVQPIKPPEKEEKKSPVMVPQPKSPANLPQLQSKPSFQLKKKEESKFIGGASGPMEIKKIVGPPQSKIKPPPDHKKEDSPKLKQAGSSLNMESFSFTQKQDPPNFSMDFGNLGGFDMGFNQPNTIKPISKPSEPKVTMPMNQGFSFEQPPIKITTPADPNNPFAELQSGYNNPILPSHTIKPTTFGTKNNPRNDIYSYFQEQQVKPKGGNSMDLI